VLILSGALRLLGAVALWAVFFVPFEWLMTGGARRRVPLAVTATNIGLLAIAAFLSAVAAAIVAARWPAMFRLDAAPSWPRFAASVALAEVLSYGLHRASHASPLLWRFHRVHHGEHVNWLTAWRTHPIDASLHLIINVGAAVVFQVPLVAHATASMARRFYASVLHAQGRWRITWLDRVIATPAFHHRHHDERAAPANFAGHLALLDVLFGTWRPSAARAGDPRRVGNHDLVAAAETLDGGVDLGVDLGARLGR
jgi:sterol desaturase/sphingolipid hydroxylase (fatty acid hydroxylase superfamily)